MAVTVNSERQQALLPQSLYTPRSAIFSEARSRNFASEGLSGQVDYTVDGLQETNHHRQHFAADNNAYRTMIYSPKEPSVTTTGREPIQMYSGPYYAACAFGGVMACGLTHAAITPLDVVKCNMQIDASKYGSTTGAFRAILQEQGARGLLRGWAPTLLGYSAQGACKYGFYEYFKKYYAVLPLCRFGWTRRGEEAQDVIYLAGSASAEFIADIALCPFEAVKVRVQTKPGFARGLADGMPKILQQEGVRGLYKGIGPLWGRQIPYSMMKFASFESTVEALYKHVVPKPKDECSTLEQLGVSFLGGYIAGVACAVISHPADNLVSFLNNSEGATIAEAVKKMGAVGIFTRGLPLRILMIGTLSGAQWVIYDAFKLSVGLRTTGGIESTESAAAEEGSASTGEGISRPNLAGIIQQEIKQ